MKKYSRLLIILVLSLLTIYGLLRLGNIDFSAETLSRVDWSWLPLIVAVFYTSILARGLRWQHILTAIGWPVDFVYAQALLLAGFFISSIVPARAGDIGRVAMLKQDHQIPVSQGVASIAVERALDVLTVLVLTIIGALWALQGHVPPQILTVTGGLTLVLGLGVVSLFAVPGLEDWLRNPLPSLSQKLTGPPDQTARPPSTPPSREQRIWDLYQKGVDFALALISGMRTLAQNRAALALVIIDSFFIWLCDGVLVYLTLISLGIVAPFSVSLLSGMTGTLATIVPITPGAVGQFEAALVATLALFNIAPTYGSLTALLLRTVSWWTFIPVAGIVTYIFGFSHVFDLTGKDVAAASKRTLPLQKLQGAYHRHRDFVLLLILFVTFRVLALVAFRPGGLVLDFSDFYWYRAFAELTHQGYYPYDNLWTTYPPLFPVVMIAIYQLSALLPPWEFPNLWFTLLLGGFFLLFEIGNFILLYLFGLKLYPANGETEAASARPEALRPAWIYMALFVPVYTLTGWFESYPLFFFLLSLYLLLNNRPYLSAFFTGIGVMIKLIPLILMPVAVQLLSQTKYNLQIAGKKLHLKKLTPGANAPSSTRLPLLAIPFDLPRIALYLAVFLITVIAIATPFYLMNPDLILGSQLITAARQPWETVWALVDGNYDYGVIPLDMRNLAWQPGDAPPTRIPWPAVTAIFGLIYLLFYTWPLAWGKPRNTLAFAGFTLCLFMLWSKGYSPQWLGWILFFIALLLPNLRGITYATILSLGNIIEANFYFIMFPQERWLFAATVLTRTLLLIVLAVEFLWIIWPNAVSPRVEKIRAWGLSALVALLLLGAIPAGLRLGQSYFDLRQLQSPYSATITRLQGEQVKGALLLNSHTVYDWFYPYLRRDYTLFMLDDYAPPGQSVDARTTALLNRMAAQTDVLWIYDADAATTTAAEEALTTWLNNRPPAHLQDIDGGRLYLFILE